MQAVWLRQPYNTITGQHGLQWLSNIGELILCDATIILIPVNPHPGTANFRCDAVGQLGREEVGLQKPLYILLQMSVLPSTSWVW